MTQAEFTYQMKDSTAPFSVIPGGSAKFSTRGQSVASTDDNPTEITWVLRDRSTGQQITATQRIGSDHETLYAEIITDFPLREGGLYETLSVSASPADTPAIRPADSPQDTCEHRLGLARGTHVMTSRGEVPVERLRMGDRVITRDHGMQAVRWVGRQSQAVSASDAPVMFNAGAIRNGRDLILSADTRIVVKGTEALIHYGAKEVLVPARNLVDGRTVMRGVTGLIEYYQVVTDRHEVIYAEAAACESFMPDAGGVNALNEKNRASLYSAMPNLRTDPASYGPHARGFVEVVYG